MAFATGAPGCCCCTNIYRGDVSINMVKVGTPNPLAPTVFATYPNDATFSVLAWTIDHMSQQAFTINYFPYNSNVNKIGRCPMKLTELRADIDVTPVFDFGSSFQGERLCTASEDEKVYYVLLDVTVPSTSYHFYEVNFDGTGNVLAFDRTMDGSGSGLVTQIEHCRFNDMLYWIGRESGDSYAKLYRANRDGTNHALVYDVGASQPAISGRARFAFDHVRGKLYVARTKSPTPWFGDILRMDLDGTNAETVYATGDVTAFSGYGVYAVRFSHSKDSLYWWEGSALTNRTDLNAGLWTAGFDGSNPTQLTTAAQAITSGASSFSIGQLEIGCGYEKLGAGTLG